MLSKAVCALSLSVAIPAFLGYPARLDVDQREKKLHEPLTVEIWPSPAAPATTVFSVRQRWLSMQVAGANAQSQDGDVLTKELQRQLRRVGCYSGEINGVWTQSARRAMQTFTNRVNATLPVERPDPILLAMLRGHPDKDCGKPCPLDENQTPEGRCIPGAMTGLSIKATLAQPKPKPLITGWTAIETAALEEDAPKIPARAPIIETASTDLPRTVIAAPPKPISQHPAPVAANRERPRLAQRPDREASRLFQQTESPRSLFQRLDTFGR